MPPQKSQFSDRSFQQAVAWFIALQSENCDQAQRDRFQIWLNRHPSHVLAYEEAERLWSDLDSLKSADIPQLVAARSAKAQAVSVKALSIAFFLIAVFAGWWLDYRIEPQLYATEVGQRMPLTLADGSSVQLNARSRISVRISWCRRQIQLLEGEALFNVAHEALRPFIVQAKGLRVRDIGTRFLLHQRSDIVRVSVLEGEVALKTEHAWLEQALLAGQSRDMDRFGHLQAIKYPNADAETAWTEGRLVFEKTPLTEVMAALELHHPVRFVLSDASLGQQTLSGSFEIGDLQPFLRAVQVMLPVKIERKKNTIIFSRLR